MCPLFTEFAKRTSPPHRKARGKSPQHQTTKRMHPTLMIGRLAIASVPAPFVLLQANRRGAGGLLEELRGRIDRRHGLQQGRDAAVHPRRGARRVPDSHCAFYSALLGSASPRRPRLSRAYPNVHFTVPNLHSPTGPCLAPWNSPARVRDLSLCSGQSPGMPYHSAPVLSWPPRAFSSHSSLCTFPIPGSRSPSPASGRPQTGFARATIRFGNCTQYGESRLSATG